MYLYGCSMNMSNATTVHEATPVIAYPYSFTKHPSPCRAYLVAPGLDEALCYGGETTPPTKPARRPLGCRWAQWSYWPFEYP
jgi:hypothetical protein